MSAVSQMGASAFGKSKSNATRRPPRSDLEMIDRVNQALEVLRGKWKVHLLFFMARGIHRHSRLLECLPGASKKMMIDTLRGLERDGIVERRIFPEVPVRVEYSLTTLGWSITEPLITLSEWEEAHGDEVTDARVRYRVGGSPPGRLDVRPQTPPQAV